MVRRLIILLIASVAAPLVCEAATAVIGLPIVVGTGSGAPPVVSMIPTSLTFAGQNTGTSSAAQTITVKNTGTVLATISSLSITGANSGDYSQTNTCPASPTTLAIGATCSISVTFTPTATGTRVASAAVSLTGAGTFTTALSGTGTIPPSCTGVAVTVASGVQNAVNAHGAGTTFCLAAGTYVEAVTPKDSDVFIGSGMGQTVLDGQNSLGFGFYIPGLNNISISQLTVKRYNNIAVRLDNCGETGFVMTYTEVSFSNVGLEACANGGTVQNNLIHDNANNGISWNANGGTITATFDNNDIYHNNTSQATANNDGSNIKVINGVTVWTNNIIHGGYANGLWDDILGVSMTVHDNEIYGILLAGDGTGGCGIVYEIQDPSQRSGTSPTNHVYNNYIHDNAQCGIGLFNSGNVEIYNNALYNNGANILYGDEGFRSDTAQSGTGCVQWSCIEINVSVHGNFSAQSSGSPVFTGYDHSPPPCAGPSSFLACTPPGTVGGPGANWKGNNNTFGVGGANTYYLPSSSTATFSVDSANKTPAQWQALGFDAGSTFTYNGGTLPGGVGPRGGFVCRAGMLGCP